MTRSRNSRRGRHSRSKCYWKSEYHGIKRVLERSALAKQKNHEFVGIEDLPHRHEYSEIWDFWYSEYSLQKIQYLMLQSLQREGAQTLVNLQLYGRKPEKDIRETRTLNREKFYGNRELSRVNFEKASYYQQLKRFENEKKESNN